MNINIIIKINTYYTIIFHITKILLKINKKI